MRLVSQYDMSVLNDIEHLMLFEVKVGVFRDAVPSPCRTLICSLFLPWPPFREVGVWKPSHTPRLWEIGTPCFHQASCCFSLLSMKPYGLLPGKSPAMLNVGS